MRWPDVFAPSPWRNHFAHRVLHKLAFALVLVASLVASLWPLAQDGVVPSPSPAASPEWPATWDGVPLRPQALGEVEARFARHFPGHIARFTDGRQVLVMRQVERPTRLLHPAEDCWRALGYRILQARLEHDARGRLWRCFHAERAGRSAQRVCERIEDAAGRAFTDTSAWYWASWRASAAGPWTAVTVVSPP
ncbi:MAG: hypothetical protein J7603_07285 [Pseudacidovorax sp.]|nr:hypothetical protein [Pseudacidovorax sp.]